MKQSAFNHVAALPEGGFILYNFLTGKCMRLSFLAKDRYDHFEQYGADNPHVKRLAELGFLVDYDELAYLRNRVRLECGDTHKLRLTICPTLQCNFACPYCFENPRGGRMEQQVQDDLVAFATAELERRHATGLEISWYGGEPLLEQGIIRSLSERLIAACDAHGIRYRASIITNGYFLGESSSELFDACRIKSMQITLDGPTAATHDETRHLRGGGPTFERILGNIASFSADCEIVIRCNVHKGNAGEYAQLEERLTALGREQGRQISVYAGHMDGHGAYEGMAMQAAEFAAFRRDTARTVPRVAYTGPICMGPKLLDLVVDERGNLYKCLESVGRDEESFGNVRDFRFTKPATGNMDVLAGWFDLAWPEADEECMSCPVLPACMGGCPQRRREGKKECSPIKALLDEYVISVGRELMSRDEG